MALKGSTKAAGGFEQEDSTVAVAAAPAAVAATAAAPAAIVKEAAPSKAQVEAAASMASTAIAKAANTSVAAPRARMVAVLSDLKDALPAVDFGVLPRLVGSNGNVMDKDNRVLGEVIEIDLVSWNHQYVVSPGDDSDEAKEAVRYSTDGVTIDDTGESVSAYLDMLRGTGGYEAANVKQYTELIGILTAAAKDQTHIGSMVQVSLSPMSRKSFDGYMLQRSVQVFRGAATAEGAEHLFIRTELKSGKGNTWTVLKVGDK